MPPSSEFGRVPTGPASPYSGFSPSTSIGDILGPGSGTQQASNATNNPDVPSGSPSSRPSIDVSVRSHASTVNGEPAHTTVVKDITFWGGLCLLICNTTGPGAVSLPLVAQSSGWIPTVIGFVVVAFLSYLSSVFICEAMTDVPGNEQFQANVEFSNLVFSFFGRKYQILLQLICFLAMQTTNIASIAICAQVFDNLLIQLFHKTCGIQVHPTAAFVCVSEQLPSASPFSGVMIMSYGTILAIIMIVPLCLMNLSENIWIQIVSCIFILLIFLQWIVTIFQHGLVPSRVPAVGKDMSQTFGSILFNFGYVTAVPSLANAKKPEVSIQKSVGASVGLMTVLFAMVSILGAMAFEIPNNSSLIQVIASSPDATTLSKIAGFVFPIAALVTSIPVNTIVLRYNLIQSRTCNKSWANFLAGGLPWLFAIPGMTGSALTTAVGWCSLFFVSATTFVIPYVLFISAKRFKKKLKRLETAEGEREGRQNKESTMTAFVDDESLDEKTVSGGLVGLAFWRKADSGLKRGGCDTDLSSKSKEESNGNVSSVMEEHERSGAGMLHYEEKDRQDPEIKCHDPEKMPMYGYAGGASPASQNASPQATSGEMSSSAHHRARTQSNQTGSITPPFLSGNNYTIPGFGMCQTRPASLRRTSSELALHLSRPEGGTISPIVEIAGGSDMDLENCFSQTRGELILKPAIQAIPRWVPVPAVVIAWGSLGLTLVGIVATIIVQIIQLA
ncbi:hypothetical protein BGX26_000648 [Mortierella sp. AD094]|nr:hypothetical protein BGX26_000648 [Mortierella sp. AD094]